MASNPDILQQLHSRIDALNQRINVATGTAMGEVVTGSVAMISGVVTENPLGAAVGAAAIVAMVVSTGVGVHAEKEKNKAFVDYRAALFGQAASQLSQEQAESAARAIADFRKALPRDAVVNVDQTAFSVVFQAIQSRAGSK